jgi:hypothetical protein
MKGVAVLVHELTAKLELPLATLSRANTSLGKITPTEFPICVSLSADMVKPLKL